MLHKDETNQENTILLKDFIQHMILAIKERCKNYDPGFAESFISQLMESVPDDLLMLLLNYSLSNVCKIPCFPVIFLMHNCRTSRKLKEYI